jgi:hypothetical protein
MTGSDKLQDPLFLPRLLLTLSFWRIRDRKPADSSQGERNEPEASSGSPRLKGRLRLTLGHAEAGHGSPRRIAGIARPGCSNELSADGRMQSIGPDQQISLHFFSRSKPHAYSRLVLLEPDPLHMRVETAFLESLHEGGLEFGSMHRHCACPKAAHRLLHGYVHEHIPAPGANAGREQRRGNRLQDVSQSELERVA